MQVSTTIKSSSAAGIFAQGTADQCFEEILLFYALTQGAFRAIFQTNIVQITENFGAVLL